MAGAERRPIVVVTGALAPYTEVLYDALAAALDRPLHVLACTARETDRHWTLQQSHRFAFEVLPGWRWHRSAVLNHYANISVVRRIRALRPAALVLNDFSPTMVMAAAAARTARIPYGIRTDGIAATDPGRSSRLHRAIRQFLARGAAFGLGPSAGSEALLRGYGLRGSVGRAPLFPAWPAPADAGAADREYDVLFCGALNEAVKGAGFFTEVVLAIAARGRRLRVRVTGDGPLRADMEARFAAAEIAARFDGFLSQEALPASYRSAHLFLFPTRGDVWGLVAHEAMQSGTVVIASPHSGIAAEIVGPGGSGLVLPLEVDAWATATLELLEAPERADRLRAAGLRAVATLTPAVAVEAYLAALQPLTDRR